MFECSRLSTLLILSLIFAATYATEERIPDALFASDLPLAMSLSSTLSLAKSERDKSAVYPGVVELESRQFPVDVTLRGNRRLSREVCSYPPLRLEFAKEDTKDSVFAKQKDLKLVVQCRNGSLYADYLRAEFLIYKALNELTPISYQVRWVDVRFVDTQGRMEDRTEGAFFIERTGRLAKRLGRKNADLAGIERQQLDASVASLLDLFQYLIANPDYSLVAAEPGEMCCHNAKLLQGLTPGTFTPVIYDFDSSGALNTKYALPPANLSIREVTERIFMGYCVNKSSLEVARQELLGAQEKVVGVFNEDPVLSDSMKSRVSGFLERGYDVLRDPGRFERNVVSRCR